MTERIRRNWPWRRDAEERESGAIEAVDAEISSPLSTILQDGSGLRTRYQASAASSFMFISLFGMTEHAIAERADLVDDELRRQGLIPIYLVDEAIFSPLRMEQRLFEYLPSVWHGARRSSDLDWPFYLRRRYLLLQAKWQPIGRIDFGDIPSWLPDHQDLAKPAEAETPRS